MAIFVLRKQKHKVNGHGFPSISSGLTNNNQENTFRPCIDCGFLSILVGTLAITRKLRLALVGFGPIAFIVLDFAGYWKTNS